MLTLRLFGGMALADDAGPIAGRAAQRRRLALLAMLAVARGKPVSRDKLIALLWPEAGTDRARHLLADSLYVIRGELGNDVVRATGNELSLDCARMTSDVIAFSDALDAGDRACAVKAYATGGPFLDGVYLSEAGEFERWVESVRARFAEDYRRALGQLAVDAATAGDHATSISWWRQLAADDRLNSRVALGLMRALAAAGDRAGALEFARAHAAIVHAELEAEPDVAITSLEAELRALRTRASPAAVQELPVATPAPWTLPPVPQPAGRRSRLAIVASAGLVVVLAATGLLLVPGGILSRRLATPRQEPSIAILPLVNVSADSADDRFVDGMTEELIGAIAAAGRLRVIASTSAFAFKGHRTDVRLIAESLHVGNILEGGLQRSGERMRVSVRLIDALNGSTRWAQVYERKINDFFAVEDEIGRMVAGALRVQLVDHAQRKNPSAEAFDFFLRGSDQRLSRSDSGARTAVGYFTHAVAADPAFAAAYAGLARSYSTVCQGRSPLSQRRNACDSATVAARRAIALDSTLADGYAELSYARSMVLDLAGARVAAERAVALDPNHEEAHEFLGKAYEWFERNDDALAEARMAVALDPLSVGAIAELGRALYFLRRDDEALAQLAPLRSLRPPVRRVRMIVGRIYEKKMMWNEAMTEFGGPSRNANADRVDLVGQLLAESGHRAEAEAILSDLKARWSSGKGKAFEVVAVYVGLHDFDNAFAWIDKSFDDLSLRVDVMDPTFDKLRADPRFAHVRARLGLATR